MKIKNFNVTGGQNVFATNIENLVLNQSVSKTNPKNLTSDIHFACTELQAKKSFHKDSENSYNDFIGSMLKASGYTVALESRKGTTLSTGNPGEIDIEVLNEDNSAFSILEGMILTSVSSDYIRDHILKVFTYDANGLKENYILAYVSVKKFDEFVSKYIEFIKGIDYQFELIRNEVALISKDFNAGSEIEILITKFNRNGKEVSLIHFLISMGR